MQTELSLKELLELPPIDRERPYTDERRARRIRAGIVAVVVILLLSLMGTGTYLFVTRPTVPDVLGMTEGEALTAAQGVEMDLIVVGTLYSVEPAGTVISQSPRISTRPLFARAIKVTLSSGKQAITIPALRGETELRARSILEQLGLNVQVVYEYAPESMGKVTSTHPEANQAIETGDIVVLRIGAPRSQVALVEYDLHGKTVIILVDEDGAHADVAKDIAIRLTSLLQAAQATVITTDTPSQSIASRITLTMSNHDVDTVYVRGSAQHEADLMPDSLPRHIFDVLGEVPLSRGYAYSDEVPGQNAAIVSFGVAGDMSLYQDARWKDNIARSIYLAFGRTLVR